MSTEQTTRRVTWSSDETRDLIHLIGQQEIRAGRLMNTETYQQVSEKMHALGYKKTPDQCKIKWKHLKNFYYEGRRKKTDKERYLVCPFYNEIQEVIGIQQPATDVAETYSRWCTVKEEIKRTVAAKPGKKQRIHYKVGCNYKNKNNSKVAAAAAAISEDDTPNGTVSDTNAHIKMELNLNMETRDSPIKIQIPNSITLSPYPPSNHHLALASTTKRYAESQASPFDTFLSRYPCPATPSFMETNAESASNEENFSYFSRTSDTALSPFDVQDAQVLQNTELSEQCESPSSYQASPSNLSHNCRSSYTPEVCIKWNSYQFNMQNTLPSLLEANKFVDVTLACEGRYLKCHKLILSVCSLYFEELLSQATTQYPIIFMKDVKFWQIQAIIEFMYKGEVNIAQERLPSLLAAAESLRVKGLAAPTTPTKLESGTINEHFQLTAAADTETPKVWTPAKRERKRKHPKSIYQQYGLVELESKKTDKENQLVTAQSTSHDESTSASNSCITTIILPDHNYQQSTLCKLSECNQDQRTNDSQSVIAPPRKCETFRNDLPLNECLTSLTATDAKNHHDHIYSKSQKDSSKGYNTKTEISNGEEGVDIHDNTIFYSYLQIDDNTSGKG